METRHPPASRAHPDPVSSSLLREGRAPVEMLPNEAFLTYRCQAGIGVWIHGFLGPGLLGRTTHNTTLSTSHLAELIVLSNGSVALN